MGDALDIEVKAINIATLYGECLYDNFSDVPQLYLVNWCYIAYKTNGVALGFVYLKFQSLKNGQGDVVLPVFHQYEHDMLKLRI